MKVNFLVSSAFINGIPNVCSNMSKTNTEVRRSFTKLTISNYKFLVPISGSHGGEHEDDSLLGHSAV
jgi:hypothetical protein